MEDRVNAGGQLPTIDLDELIGRTYIEPPQDDSSYTQCRVTIDDIQPEYNKSEVESNVLHFKERVVRFRSRKLEFFLLCLPDDLTVVHF